MTIRVFGHKSPDTDSTGSAIVWAWHLNKIKRGTAEAVLLGEPNKEARFMLKYWRRKMPPIIDDVSPGEPVVIVDTNNPEELPDSIAKADIRAIIDHHKLVGGLETDVPIDVTIRPLACTATIIHDLIGAEKMNGAPKWVKGTILTCILSDTLEFRMPTTTDRDQDVAQGLAEELEIGIPAYAAEMFAAKSDVSAFSDAELLRMDSKKYAVGGSKFRVSVLETTAPETVLARKASLMESMGTVASEDGVDQALLFVVDILNKQSTLLVPNDLVRKVAKASFGVTAKGDTAILKGVISRKKQIIPNLKA